MTGSALAFRRLGALALPIRRFGVPLGCSIVSAECAVLPSFEGFSALNAELDRTGPRHLSREGETYGTERTTRFDDIARVRVRSIALVRLRPHQQQRGRLERQPVID